jgi:uncharacterized protein (DUF1015 family)
MSSAPLIRPFAALRPRAEHAADVIAPPYDVVTTDEARALAAGRPWSFLHISRPEIDLPAGSSPYADSAYARGAANMRALRARGILVRDSEPSLYIYRLQMNGHTQTGVAFVASVAAYEAHRIKRHELTRPDKENDRVKNIAALNAQTGPVLLAHRADESIAMLLRASVTVPPLFEVPGPNGTRHAVWQVAAPERIAAFLAAFDALDALYIADGHHRSAAAARIAAERRREPGSSSPAAFASHDYFLAVAFPHDEMRILGYHRVVRDLRGSSPAAFLERLGQTFTVVPSDQPVEPASPRSFGLFLEGRWYALTLRSELVRPDDAVASLDVSLLQDRVLAPLLGIGDPRTDPRIDFVGGARGLAELERRVGEGAAAAAFSMHATRMSELMAVADAGRLMPPKSTWFEPKLADGLLSHVLD